MFPLLFSSPKTTGGLTTCFISPLIYDLIVFKAYCIAFLCTVLIVCPLFFSSLLCFDTFLCEWGEKRGKIHALDGGGICRFLPSLRAQSYSFFHLLGKRFLYSSHDKSTRLMIKWIMNCKLYVYYKSNYIYISVPLQSIYLLS